MIRRTLPFLVMSILPLVSCGTENSKSEVKIPPLTIVEAQQDLATIVSKVRSLYGPLEYKEARFGYRFDDLIKQAEKEVAAAKTENEVLGAFRSLLMKFRDGHVSISYPGNSSDVRSYKIGIFLVPIDGHALVATVEPAMEEQGVKAGDELVTIDGVKPFDLMPIIKKYDAFGNDLSDLHAIMRVTNRRFYMTELLPVKPFASLVLARADGTTYEAQGLWEKVKESTTKFELVPNDASNIPKFVFTGAIDMKDAAKGSVMEMGAYKPYFVSSQVKETYSLTEVEPNDDFLKKYEVTRKQLQDEKGKAIYAALYKYHGKTILLVRQPAYFHEKLEIKNILNGYRALLDQFDEIADVLVIDQNHNPGGYLEYAQNFFSLFINKPAFNLVQKFNTDRSWVFGLNSWADEIEKEHPGFAKMLRLRSELVDQAMVKGLSVTEPMAFGYDYVQPDSKYTWKKPILVLTDELAGSCGDIFPMYMQRNGIAKTFGQRTMGLGGNVEEVVTLPFSQASVHLTRGLFTTYKPDHNYTESEFVENNGILPDYPHTITVQDFRDGFVKYFATFSETAAKL